jgi:hypothetical protein
MHKGVIGVSHDDFVATLIKHGNNVSAIGGLVWLSYLAVTGFFKVHKHSLRREPHRLQVLQSGQRVSSY